MMQEEKLMLQEIQVEEHTERDLQAEWEEVNRLIEEQSQSSQEYLTGKFTFD